MFSLVEYKTIVKKQIAQLFNINYNLKINKDKLYNKDSFEVSETNLKNAKRIKQIEMKFGLIWQIAIGEYYQFKNLKQGHISGCDVLSEDRKIIIELKNKYNTDNASSKKSNYDKLFNFKKNNLDYRCIYGVINDKTPKHNYIIKDELTIEYISDDLLLELIFEENKQEIEDFLRETTSEIILNISR